MGIAGGFAGHRAQAKTLAGVEGGGLQPAIVEAERFALAVFQEQFPVVGALECAVHGFLDFAPVHAGAGKEQVGIGHGVLLKSRQKALRRLIHIVRTGPSGKAEGGFCDGAFAHLTRRPWTVP